MTFKEAICALNSLQTNAVTISKSIHLRQHQKHNEVNVNLRDTEKFLERIDDGSTLKAIEKLSFIHVAGSKGKGSVCTYTDAILREFNIKTGLFTSPHLISVTERIKIRGAQLSQNQFSKYFWEVYDALNKKKNHEFDLPNYFKFLQIMAFYIFVKEKVDVAIVEVGIGGQFDSTNIIKNTEIVGISALQLEHTQLLGNTLEEIAWQKAGIIKENSHVFYMPQPSECIKVISERFKELKGKSLSLAPSTPDYKWINCSKPDFTTSEVKALNFSLASQLSGKWLKNRQLLSENLFIGDVLNEIPDKFTSAFNKCQFDGRFQVIDGKNDITFYLDGAHTKDSMSICANWFSKQLHKVGDDKSECINVLIFNVTGDRDSELIMKQLHSIRFDYVCFTTNILNNDAYNEKCENFTGILSTAQFDRCINHKDIWINLLNSSRTSNTTQIVMCHPTIQNAIDFMLSIRDNNRLNRINVLFTGSLHLVGGALKLIQELRYDKKNIKHEEEFKNVKKLRTV